MFVSLTDEIIEFQRIEVTCLELHRVAELTLEFLSFECLLKNVTIIFPSNPTSGSVVYQKAHNMCKNICIRVFAIASFIMS